MALSKINVGPRFKFLFIMLLVTICAAFAIFRMVQIHDRLDVVVITNNVKASLVSNMRQTVSIRMKEMANFTRVDRVASMPDSVKRIRYQAVIYTEYEGKLHELFGHASGQTPEERKMLLKIGAAASAATPVIAKITQLGLSQKSLEAGAVLDKDFRGATYVAWMDALNELNAIEADLTNKAAAEASLAYDEARLQILLLAAVVIVLGVRIAWISLV